MFESSYLSLNSKIAKRAIIAMNTILSQKESKFSTDKRNYKLGNTLSLNWNSSNKKKARYMNKYLPTPLYKIITPKQRFVLTLQMLITTAADNSLEYCFIVFRENKT